MKKIILVFCMAALLVACNEEKKTDTATEATPAAAPAEKPPVEILNDSNLVASTMASFTAFENKDIEGYTTGMADNVMFRWSGGDSLAGKQAVKDYYTGRFNIIDNIKFSDHISLPLMANASPVANVPTGKWMLSWYKVSVKYKNGKSIAFGHTIPSITMMQARWISLISILTGPRSWQPLNKMQ
ncbi:MAG: nuclear transport factor 2 family protein [Chitinophagaceae bacterium]|nr:nuclear transport factor 2 family protein [Chitinophagaceae bacterium]